MEPTITEREACLLADRQEIVVVKAEIRNLGEVEMQVTRGLGFHKRMRFARTFAPARLIVRLQARELPDADLDAAEIETLIDYGYSWQEIASAHREIIHLWPHLTEEDTQEAAATFKSAALSGPCFCEGKFQCTKHAIAEQMS